MPAPRRIVITDCDLGPADAETAILRAAFGPDVEVLVGDCRSADDVLSMAADADALLVQWAPITAEVLSGLRRCSVISRYGIGTDMIDKAAAQARGIEVYNVPHYCAEEVATHAVALLLALWRRLPALDGSVRAGRWDAGGVVGDVGRLSGATLGLVGLGQIAAIVARVFRSFGTRVVAYDPYAAAADGIELVGLAELAARGDLVSLHCPLTEETRHVVDESFLAALRPHAVLVNTARGDLVDAEALTSALVGRRLAGAGLDVFGTEPLAPDSPLRSCPNLLLSPHAAWCSAEALPALRAEAAHNIVRHFAARP
jgi:D-3-phosphoglycerate dehydrogenase